MGLLGDIILNEYMERKAERRAEQLQGLLGQRYQPGMGQGMVENRGLLGGQIDPTQFAAQMMAIPGYQGAGERIFSHLAGQQMAGDTALQAQAMRNEQSGLNKQAELSTMTPYQRAKLGIERTQAWLDSNRVALKERFGIDDKTADDYMSAIKPYKSAVDQWERISTLVTQKGGTARLNPYESEAVMRSMYRAISNEAFMSDDREAEQARKSLMGRFETLLQKYDKGGTILKAEVDQMMAAFSGLAQHSRQRIQQANQQIMEKRQEYGVQSRPFGFFDPSTTGLPWQDPGAQRGTGALPGPQASGAAGGGMTVEEFNELARQQRYPGVEYRYGNRSKE